MKGYYFNNLIKKTTIQFLDIFNDIKIAKYDANGNILNYVDVPIKLSSKEKFYSWVRDRGNVSYFPMLAANLTAINYTGSERGTNNQIEIPVSNISTVRHLNLVPYDMEFELYIVALYVTEIEQIIEQILPFFDPFVYTTIDLSNIENSFDIKLLLTGASLDKSVEIEEEAYRTVKWTLNFTAKAYLLKPITDTKLIHKIYLQTRNLDKYTETPSISGDGIYETMYLSGYKDESGELFYKYELIGNE